MTNRTFHGARKDVSTASEARRLRLDFNRVQRRLTALYGHNDAQAESVELLHKADRIARELQSIRADSVHAVEVKLKVALNLAEDRIDRTPQ